MKLNKKGFTLIELLAVIVILLAISVIAISSISAAIERNKKKQDAAKIAVIESYASLYYQEHKNSMAGYNCIELADLELSDSERKNADGDPFEGVVMIENGKFVYKDNRTSCP